jgi:D-apiose dehydrogenase
MPSPLRGGLIGCGYFARNHLHGWREVSGAEITAVCDLDAKRAHDTAHDFGIPAAYGDVETMLREARLDLVDVVTQPASHRSLVETVARHGIPVICQKPLAPSLQDAEAMVRACEAAGVPFMVHENFRWQTPLRAQVSSSARWHTCTVAPSASTRGSVPRTSPPSCSPCKVAPPALSR